MLPFELYTCVSMTNIPSISVQRERTLLTVMWAKNKSFRFLPKYQQFCRTYNQSKRQIWRENCYSKQLCTAFDPLTFNLGPNGAFI